MKTEKLSFTVCILLSLFLACPSLFGGAATRPIPSDPAALRPNARLRGGPASEMDIAEIAQLDALPLFTPHADRGDFLLKPPYVKAPEQTVRGDVPKGRIEHFTLDAANSKFYPDTGLRDTAAGRAVSVYVPSQYVRGTPAPVIVCHDAMGAISLSKGAIHERSHRGKDNLLRFPQNRSDRRQCDGQIFRARIPGGRRDNHDLEWLFRIARFARQRCELSKTALTPEINMPTDGRLRLLAAKPIEGFDLSRREYRVHVCERCM